MLHPRSKLRKNDVYYLNNSKELFSRLQYVKELKIVTQKLHFKRNNLVPARRGGAPALIDLRICKCANEQPNS